MGERSAKVPEDEWEVQRQSDGERKGSVAAVKQDDRGDVTTAA
jgi:hypothetical protein